jgi:hypothetical protein
MGFNRERFLLKCVAWILGVQFGVFILAGLMCSYGYFTKIRMINKVEQQASVCPGMIIRIRESAQESLAVLLALLGGGTLAVGEMKRIKRYEDVEPEPETPNESLEERVERMRRESNNK